MPTQGMGAAGCSGATGGQDPQPDPQRSPQSHSEWLGPRGCLSRSRAPVSGGTADVPRAGGGLGQLPHPLHQARNVMLPPLTWGRAGFRPLRRALLRGPACPGGHQSLLGGTQGTAGGVCRGTPPFHNPWPHGFPLWGHTSFSGGYGGTEAIILPPTLIPHPTNSTKRHGSCPAHHHHSAAGGGGGTGWDAGCLPPLPAPHCCWEQLTGLGTAVPSRRAPGPEARRAGGRAEPQPLRPTAPPCAASSSPSAPWQVRGAHPAVWGERWGSPLPLALSLGACHPWVQGSVHRPPGCPHALFAHRRAPSAVRAPPPHARPPPSHASSPLGHHQPPHPHPGVPPRRCVSPPPRCELQEPGGEAAPGPDDQLQPAPAPGPARGPSHRCHPQAHPHQPHLPGETPPQPPAAGGSMDLGCWGDAAGAQVALVGWDLSPWRGQMAKATSPLPCLPERAGGDPHHQRLDRDGETSDSPPPSVTFSPRGGLSP